MEEFVKLKDITKVYHMGEVEIRAADNINFSIKKGEFVVIVGPSGAGKTTVLNILGGMDTATGGTLTVDGKDITAYDSRQLTGYRRDDIGFVFQFYNLIPILTVEENMTLPLLLDDKKVDRAHFDSLVQVLGLQHRLGHLPSELSGGQQQRVSIGRALMNNPAILLADEPTGNLDSKNSKEIVELLRQFNKALNQTVIIITHDERIALDADRVIAVEDGKIVKDEVIRQ